MTRLRLVPDDIGTPDPERFEILDRLGRGGMGVVYRVFDRERGGEVALKMLRNVDATGIYRFKREFRTMADIAHPNLVSLYELESIGGRWLFTMELLRGQTFLDHVRGKPAPSTSESRAPVPDADPSCTATLPTHSQVRAPPDRDDADFDRGRLRAAMRQLVAGVCALHDAGYTHCDIKPSNVLVTPEGRVVLLDFGVIQQFRASDWHEEPGAVAGTPAYLAPEQARGAPVPASDWYSVGVMLYEALTGARPLTGDVKGLLLAKQTVVPARPSERVTGLPADLERLCMRLLSIDPEDRPSDAEMRQAVGLAFASAAGEIAGGAQPEPMIGRARQLDLLHRAWDETQESAVGRTVHVHGRSGMGKSLLARRFLDEVASRHDAVVLAGRCYEREVVPFKAVDSIVDSLSRYLVSLPPHEAAALLPRDILMLVRMFPVLERVEVVASAPRRKLQAPDPHELRRRGFLALRQLMEQIAERRPLVLFIDDLHWGDADSAPLLDALMRPPDTPPLLLLTCYRTDEFERSAVLQALSRRSARLGPAVNVCHIEVGALDDRDARHLARRLLAGRHVDRLARVIARESGGNPYFIHELARFAGRNVDAFRRGTITLQQVTRSRVAELTDDVRRVMELIAVAGGPTTQTILGKAARIDAGQMPGIMQELRARNLVTVTGLRANDKVEAYHDRIRQTITDELDDAVRKGHHVRLALAVQTSSSPDPETLAFHFRAADERERAAIYTLAAAEQAAGALAFERAASLYRRALELSADQESDEYLDLEIKLGEALVQAGRSAEAATVYSRAAERAGGSRTLELRRRAAFQYLRAGHVDEGMSIAREVLEVLGFRIGRTPRRNLLSLLWRRFRLRLRGLRFRERDPAEIPPETLARIDVCWSLASGLSMVEPIQSADFQTRNLLFALGAGEPNRIARAFAVEAGFAALPGDAGRKRAERVLQTASELATRVGKPELRGWVWGTSSLVEYQRGQFQTARDHAQRALRILREECTGVAWEISTVELYLLWSYYYLGEIGTLSDRLAALLDEARQRGDRYAASSMRLGISNLPWLAEDDPAEAEHQIDLAMREWSTRGFQLQHYWELVARCHALLYRDDVVEAHDRLHAAWPRISRALLLRIELVRIEAIHLRARCAIARAAHGEQPEQLLRDAARDAGKLAREKVEWARALATLVRACVSLARGAGPRAAELFARAEEGLLEHRMALFAAVARRRRGEVIGGREGRGLIAQADDWMKRQGIVAPAKMTRLFAPGR